MRPAHLLAAAVAAAFATQTSAQAPRVVMGEMTVPSEPGIEIYVRNKRPADLSAFRPERTVLFVHGATYPAHTSFDLKLDGMSWMDYIAARGYDVLSEALDLPLQDAKREQACGDFSVDLVADDGSGNTVVIENQLEKSNHDHLGKLITYLAALNAR